MSEHNGTDALGNLASHDEALTEVPELTREDAPAAPRIEVATDEPPPTVEHRDR